MTSMMSYDKNMLLALAFAYLYKEHGCRCRYGNWHQGRAVWALFAPVEGSDAPALPEPTPCSHRHTNIGGIPDVVMKVLIDEMDDGWDDSLRILGYDAYSVKKLRAQDTR